ncbi:hypothetical protein BKA93DRAFT_726606 [Sparassis latifolia]
MADRRSFDHSKPLEDSYRPSSPPSNRAYSTPERYHGTDSHAHSSHSHYPSTSPSKSYVPHTPVPPSLPPLASITSQQPIRYLRVLTLLIEDNRNGQTENQLAELRVELRESPDGCYLADAKDICDALQSSPSRIDGSAKVFTMRGKYRHYFLRLTSEGEMECSPVNLTVTMDRTIEIFIEDVRMAVYLVLRTDDTNFIGTVPFLCVEPYAGGEQPSAFAFASRARYVDSNHRPHEDSFASS